MFFALTLLLITQQPEYLIETYVDSRTGEVSTSIDTDWSGPRMPPPYDEMDLPVESEPADDGRLRPALTFPDSLGRLPAENPGHAGRTIWRPQRMISDGN